MTFGGGEGIWRNIGDLQQAEADEIVRGAIEAGINFIDTANVYAEGLSEQITVRRCAISASPGTR